MTTGFFDPLLAEAFTGVQPQNTQNNQNTQKKRKRFTDFTEFGAEATDPYETINAAFKESYGFDLTPQEVEQLRSGTPLEFEEGDVFSTRSFGRPFDVVFGEATSGVKPDDVVSGADPADPAEALPRAEEVFPGGVFDPNIFQPYVDKILSDMGVAEGATIVGAGPGDSFIGNVEVQLADGSYININASIDSNGNSFIVVTGVAIKSRTYTFASSTGVSTLAEDSPSFVATTHPELWKEANAVFPPAQYGTAPAMALAYLQSQGNVPSPFASQKDWQTWWDDVYIPLVEQIQASGEATLTVESNYLPPPWRISGSQTQQPGSGTQGEGVIPTVNLPSEVPGWFNQFQTDVDRLDGVLRGFGLTDEQLAEIQKGLDLGGDLDSLIRGFGPSLTTAQLDRIGRALKDAQNLEIILGDMGNVDPELRETLRTMLGQGESLQKILPTLGFTQVQVDQIGGILTNLEAIELAIPGLARSLGSLPDAEALAKNISDALMDGQSLEDILPRLNLSYLQSSRIRNAAADARFMRRVLPDLQLPEGLAEQINTMYNQGLYLGENVHKIAGIDPIVARNISKAAEDVRFIHTTLPGIVPGLSKALMDQLTTAVARGEDLERILPNLPGMNPALLNEISNTWDSVINLRGVLRSRWNLNPDTIEDITTLAGDVDSLKENLELLPGVPQEVKDSIAITLGEARYLSEYLRNQVFLDSSVRKQLIEAKGMGEDLQKFMSTELNLNPATIENINAGMKEAKALSEFLIKELNVNPKLMDDIALHRASAEDFQGFLGTLGIPQDRINEINGFMEEVRTFQTDVLDKFEFDPSAVKEGLGKLDKEFDKIVGKAQLLGEMDVSLDLQSIGDQILLVSREGGELQRFLQSIGLDPELAKEIADTQQDVKDLDQALKNLGVSDAVANQLKKINILAEGAHDRLSRLNEAISPGVREELGDIRTAAVGTAAALRNVRLPNLDFGQITEPLTDIESRLRQLENPVISPNLRRALTRPQMAELEESIQDQLRSVIQDLEFDPDEYQRSQANIIERRFQEARERLGRQFGIDPGGPKTGRAQRQFEILESSLITELNQLDAQVQERVDRIKQQTLSNLTGTLTAISQSTIQQQQLAENARQFDNNMRQRLREFGLQETQVEASIRKMNDDIIQRTRQISAEIGQAWAGISGKIGVGTEEISAKSLGIDLTGVGPELPFLPSSQSPQAKNMRDSFQALTGREPTRAEMIELMDGNSVSVEGIPTLEARRLSAQITQQNLERVAKYDSIADRLALDRDGFNEAVEQADRQWNLTTLNVAEEFGIDQQAFRTAKYALDSQTNALFFNTELTPEQRAEEINKLTQGIAEQYFPEQSSEFLQANDMFNRLYGNQQSQIARSFSLDAQNFTTGMRLAQQQEDRMLGVWSAVFEGRAVKNPKFSSFNEEEERAVIVERIVPEITALGLPGSSESQRDAFKAVDEWWEDASDEQKESLRSTLELYFPEYLFPDDQLRATMVQFLQRNDKHDFRLTGVKRDWINSLSKDEFSALMGIIGAANSAPERQQGSSFLASLGSLLGAGLGAFVGFKAAGGPAGIIPGAQAGSQVGRDAVEVAGG